MRGARSLFIVVPLALAVSGCLRSTQTYMVYDPNTGQSYTTTAPPQQAYGYPQQQGFELYGQRGAQAGAQQSYAQQTQQTQQTQQVQQTQQDDIPQRGLFTSRRSSSSYAVAPAPAPYCTT